MAEPTIIEQPTAAIVQAARAKLWRKAVMRMTRRQLGAVTGYSPDAIKYYERGYGPEGRAIPPRSLMRYRLVCAGLGNTGFDWEER